MTDRFIGLRHHSLYFDFAIVNAENATLREYIVQIVEEFFGLIQKLLRILFLSHIKILIRIKKKKLKRPARTAVFKIKHFSTFQPKDRVG